MSKPRDQHGRIERLVDVEHLTSRKVTIIGLGRMGQPVAAQLVRHGVATGEGGHLWIIDGDRVQAHNLIGTDCLHEHIGRPKAEAAASLLRVIDPQVNVTYWYRELADADARQVHSLAQRSDLMCLFADDWALMLDFADRCADCCPLVMAVFGSRVDLAEVGWSIPGKTPPLRATMGHRKRTAIQGAAALGCDISFVTSVVAGVCLSLLLDGRHGSDMLPCDAGAPLLLIGLRRTWIFENQPDDVVRSIIRVGSPTPSLKGT